jgi:hypothetical protein
MVHTRAVEEATLDIPDGSTEHGHGGGEAPCDNAMPAPPRPPVNLE